MSFGKLKKLSVGHLTLEFLQCIAEQKRPWLFAAIVWWTRTRGAEDYRVRAESYYVGQIVRGLPLAPRKAPSFISFSLLLSLLKPCFYLFTAIYIKSTACRLPVTMDSSCAKTSPNGLPDRTAHGLVSSNQRASDVTSLWRARTHLFRLTMGLAPSTLPSHIISLILTQLQAYRT